MRIASLARKTKKTPTEVLSLAESIGVDVNKGSNTKLSDDELSQIIEQFGLVLQEKKTEEVKEVTEQPLKAIEDVPVLTENSEASIEIVEEKINTEELTLPPEEIVLETGNSSEENEPEEQEIIVTEPDVEIEIAEESTEINVTEENTPIIETRESEESDEDLTYSEKAALDLSVKVIKPPKVQLQGLTVKGKIDLPEPKPKTEETEKLQPEEKKQNSEEILYTKGPERRRRKYNRKKTKRENPIIAERKKQERERIKKEEIRLRKIKEAKALHYKNLISETSIQPTRTKKKAKKATKTKSQQKVTLPPTNNILKKFWRWMNT